MKLILILLSLSISLIGCGSDNSSEEAATVQNVKGNSFNEAAMLSAYKKLCIDNNQPVIEANYQSCLNLWSTYNGPNPCQTNKDLSLAAVQNEWNVLQATAKANFNYCQSDYRAIGNYCPTKYEEEIAFEVDLRCYSATIR